MGAAIIASIRKTYKVRVCETDKRRARTIASKYKVSVDDLATVIKNSNIILLAVKPQSFEAVLTAIKPHITKKHLVLSIAAGITTKYIEKKLGIGIKVVRTMPNLPAQIAQGITGLCAGQNVTSPNLKQAENLLKFVGETVIVEEKMIDALTAVSGSGPAYVFLFVEMFIKAAQSLGLKKADARKLVMQTLSGSMQLLERTGDDAGDLRARVTSKGGTTAAALAEFKRKGFDKMFKAALVAAKKRSKQLAK